MACHAPGEAEEYAVEDAPAFGMKTTVSCPRKENLVKQPSALAPHTLPGSPPAEWEQWVWKSPHSGDIIASMAPVQGQNSRPGTVSRCLEVAAALRISLSLSLSLSLSPPFESTRYREDAFSREHLCTPTRGDVPRPG